MFRLVHSNVPFFAIFHLILQVLKPLSRVHQGSFVFQVSIGVLCSKQYLEKEIHQEMYSATIIVCLESLAKSHAAGTELHCCNTNGNKLLTRQVALNVLCIAE